MNWMASFSDELMKISEAQRVEEAFHHEVEDVDGLKKKLKPGDVLFTAPLRSKMKGVVGRYLFKPLSKKIQGTDYGHAALYVGDGEVVDTRLGQGTKKVTLEHVARTNQIVALRPQVTPEERKAAVEYAEGQVGVPYSMTHLVGSVSPVRPKHHKPDKAPEKHICSALVASAYKDRKFTDVATSVTRPNELMQSRLLRPVAALRKEH